MKPEMIASVVSAIKSRRARVLISVISLALVFCLLTSFVVLKLNRVTISEDGALLSTFTTIEDEQDKLLAAAGIVLEETDEVTFTREGQSIVLNVLRGFDVSVHADKKIITVTAAASDTVADVLAKAEVAYSENDKLSAEANAVVTPGMEITLVRRTTATVTETVAIPFEKITHESDALYKGAKKITQAGANGEKTLTYTVVYEDGKEVSRTLSNTEVTKKAKDEITLVGTKQRTASSYGQKMSAEELEGAKLLSVIATAYCNTSDGGQVTALGEPTGFGIVAVDPGVIPLGSKLYITSADGSYVYGYCIAGDTGGAIKGNRVDLFLGSESECRAFGRRPMQVYVLN